MQRLGDGARLHAAAPSMGAAAHAASAEPEPAIVTPPRGRLAHAFIRTIDVAVASAVLVATAPLLIAIAILIKRDSPGPVLFRHVRIGANSRRRDVPYRGPHRRAKDLYGKPFALYKFRTMYADARERFPELYEYRYDPHELHSMPIKVLVSTKNPASGPGVQPAAGLLDDPRLTRVGRWLRRSSLDELPNFLNVLRGDMHLVGPRPDIYENIRYYERRHLAKLEVRPGVTGLAQVQGRGNLSFHETNEWDLEYVQKRSVWLDLRILAKTLWVSVRGDGAF
ncbi:MAG TPA: sugar transferase [Acidimicrobiales bacterium]|nr:sugar transferase [Acidimicrobiales bacterium]